MHAMPFGPAAPWRALHASARTACMALAVAWMPVAAQKVETGAYASATYEFIGSDARVTIAPMSVGSPYGTPFALVSDTVEVVREGPFQAVASLEYIGFANSVNRGLGVQARGRSTVTPYTLPVEDFTATAPVIEVVAGFVDTVSFHSSRVSAGGSILFELRPVSLTGWLDVSNCASLYVVPGVGTCFARMLASFYLDSGSGELRQEEQTNAFVAAGGSTTWNASQVGNQALGGQVFVMPNGTTLEMAVQLLVQVAVSPGLLPEAAPAQAEAFGNLANTLVWNGLRNFRDESGLPLDDVTVQSAAGFDWLSPVPELPSGVLAVLGLAALICRRKAFGSASVEKSGAHSQLPYKP